MLYTTSTIKNIQLGKYKRLITIGCSFTRYKWATWADLLASEMPHAEHINQAQSGAGNLYISVNLNQLIHKLKLCETDLVGIMWSTFYREDRYHGEYGHSKWITPGNIFTQNQIPMDFVKEHCDTRGMMLRDLAIIDNTMGMLKSAPFDSFAMMGVSIKGQGYYAGFSDEQQVSDLSEIQSMYSNTGVLELDLLKHCGDTWPVHYTYINSPYKPQGGDGSVIQDYHPSSYVYRDYLIKLGFNMTGESEKLAEYSDNLMTTIHGDDVFLDPQWPWNAFTGAVL